jgi:hypothetical protein
MGIIMIRLRSSALVDRLTAPKGSRPRAPARPPAAARPMPRAARLEQTAHAGGGAAARRRGVLARGAIKESQA